MENSSTFLTRATGKRTEQRMCQMAGSGAGVRKGDAELRFRDDESKVPVGSPCKNGKLGPGY